MGMMSGSNAGNLALIEDIKEIKREIDSMRERGGGVISDAYSREKDYGTGDYCIYLNELYKFTSPKPAGDWDRTKVVPCTIGNELSLLNTNNIKYYTIMRADSAEGISKEEANDLIDNPTKLIGKINCPYIINYRDLVGDTFLGGGYKCVFGYTYANDEYGAQIILTPSAVIKLRAKYNGTWTSIREI